MKECGRRERYKRVREGEKRQYQWVGEEEMREVSGGYASNASTEEVGVASKVSKAASPEHKHERRVRERREGRRVWPTLTDGYVRKERHKTPGQQYKRTYTDGREEPKIRKRYVGRKRVMAGMDRPRKLQGREDFEGMAMQQDHRTAWDMVERQRRRENRKGIVGRGVASNSKGVASQASQASQEREEQRVRKRRRRKCERARNRYEYSRRRRVEEEVMEEREEVIRKRKEGGHREPVGWWDRRWEREERAAGLASHGGGSLASHVGGSLASHVGGSLASHVGGSLASHGGSLASHGGSLASHGGSLASHVGGSEAASEERELRGEAGRMPSKEREEREEVDQVGRKREAGKVGSEGRNNIYGEDCRKYRERYTSEVGKREGLRKGKRRGSSEVRNRRGRGKGTYGGGLRKSNVRKSKGLGYTGRGEGYGRREESVRRGVKERKERTGVVGPVSMRRKKWWEREGVGATPEEQEANKEKAREKKSKSRGVERKGLERRVKWEGKVRTLGEVLGPRYVGPYRSENQERRQLGENVRRSSKRRSKGGEGEWSMDVEAGRMRAEVKKEQEKRAKAGARWRRREKRQKWGSGGRESQGME